MRHPLLLYSCDKCGHEATTQLLDGVCVWRDNLGREAPIPRQIGICHDCRKIVALERLPLLKDVASATNAVQHQRRLEVTDCSLDEQHVSLYLDQIRRNTDALEVLLTVIRLRLKPVCLSCGGFHVVPLSKIEAPSGDRSIATGIQHPDCHGTIHVRRISGWFASSVSSKFTYNVFGELIDVVENFSAHEEIEARSHHWQFSAGINRIWRRLSLFKGNN